MLCSPAQTLWRPARCRVRDLRRAGLPALPQGVGLPSLPHSARSARMSEATMTPSSTACVALVGVACCTCACSRSKMHHPGCCTRPAIKISYGLQVVITLIKPPVLL